MTGHWPVAVSISLLVMLAGTSSAARDSNVKRLAGDISLQRIVRLWDRADYISKLAQKSYVEYHAQYTRPEGPPSSWHIEEVYNYCTACLDMLTPQEKKRYAEYLISCQDPKYGAFMDKYGGMIYSVKARSLLAALGDYKPRYPLAVCDPTLFPEGVSEQMGGAAFYKWIDRVFHEWDPYGAGSIVGHFLAPHCINLRERGGNIEDSEYVHAFRRWIRENQQKNGLWDPTGKYPTYLEWDGLFKMTETFGRTNTPIPRPGRIIKTILACRNDADGNFGPGRCTNYNALRLLGDLSVDNGGIYAEQILQAMEWYATCILSRYDAATGHFWPNDVWPHEGDPNVTGTWSALHEAAAIRGYCRKLLAQLVPDKSPEEVRASVHGAPAVEVPRMAAPPVIDGQLNDEEWAGAAQVSGFVEYMGHGPAQCDTQVRLGWDNEHLYVAFVCQEPDTKALVVKQHEPDSDRLFLDDCVELFIKPRSDEDTYYHWIVNAAGTVFDAASKRATPDSDVEWNSGCSVATSVAAGKWIVEMAIPISAIGVTPAAGDVWTGNLGREKWTAPQEITCWSCTRGGFHNTHRFGQFIFK